MQHCFNEVYNDNTFGHVRKGTFTDHMEKRVSWVQYYNMRIIFFLFRLSFRMYCSSNRSFPPVWIVILWHQQQTDTPLLLVQVRMRRALFNHFLQGTHQHHSNLWADFYISIPAIIKDIWLAAASLQMCRMRFRCAERNMKLLICCADECAEIWIEDGSKLHTLRCFRNQLFALKCNGSIISYICITCLVKWKLCNMA